MSGLIRTWSMGMGGGPGVPGRQVRRVERPRPLKMPLTLEDTVTLVEAVTKQLSSGCYDRMVRSAILNLSHNLKRLGPQVESGDREKLDRLQVAMRAACKDEQLDLVSRVHLLELIELRAMAWLPNQNVTNYYKQKLLQIEAEMADSGPESPATAPVQLNPSAPDFRQCVPPSHGFAPGSAPHQHSLMSGTSHLLMNLNTPSHSHGLHTSPPSLNIQQPPMAHRRNNVLRNSGDSLERTSSLEDRNSDRRHQSGGADLASLQNGSGDGDNEYAATVTSSAGTITVTGTSIDLVRTAKRVLDQYFSLEGPVIVGEIPLDEHALPQDDLHHPVVQSKVHVVRSPRPPLAPTLAEAGSSSIATRRASFTKNASASEVAKPEITYARAELLQMAASPLCRVPPPDWDKVLQSVPSVVKARPQKVVGGPARQLIERAVDELARQEAAKAV